MFQVCSDPSARFLATGPRGLSVQPRGRSRVNLEGRGEVALGTLSAIDYTPDEEAGCPRRAVDFLESHRKSVATSKCKTQDQTPRPWEAVQLRGSECGVRVTLPGSDPSSITYQLGDFGQESLNVLTLGLSFLICTVGPITYPIHGITRH